MISIISSISSISIIISIISVSSIRSISSWPVHSTSEQDFQSRLPASYFYC